MYELIALRGRFTPDVFVFLQKLVRRNSEHRLAASTVFDFTRRTTVKIIIVTRLLLYTRIGNIL